jgi:hypothetical protein
MSILHFRDFSSYRYQATSMAFAGEMVARDGAGQGICAMRCAQTSAIETLFLVV